MVTYAIERLQTDSVQHNQRFYIFVASTRLVLDWQAFPRILNRLKLGVDFEYWSPDIEVTLNAVQTHKSRNTVNNNKVHNAPVKIL